MAILSKRFSSRFGPVQHSNDSEGWIARAIGGRATFSGKTVNESNALEYSPIFACVKILAETVGILPLQVFEELKSGTKVRSKEHPVNDLFSFESNPAMTGYTLKETLQGHVGTWGNAYAELQRNGRGDVVAIWPLRPDLTRPVMNPETGALQYQTDIGGVRHAIPADRVLHLKGLGFDGLQGYSFAWFGRQAIGLGLAAEEFGSRWFGQGSQGGILLKHPGPKPLSKEGRDHLREFMAEEEAGLENAHRVRVLQEGVSYERIGIPPEEAQFLQTRNFQVAEIARLYRMPLTKLQSLERAIQNNIETQQIEFVVDTMLPWATRWEQESNRRLFKKEERDRFYLKFNFNALMRGDNNSRSNFYLRAAGGPWMTTNEVRALEELEDVKGGDEVRSPVNMGSIENLNDIGNTNPGVTNSVP